MSDRDDPPPFDQQPAGPERRSEFRFPTGSDRQAMLVALIDGDPYPARVRNISISGISLVLGRSYPAEALLSMQLRNLNRNVVRQLRVRVLYAVEHPNGDWIIGGAFVRPLTGAELKALL